MAHIPAQTPTDLFTWMESGLGSLILRFLFLDPYIEGSFVLSAHNTLHLMHVRGPGFIKLTWFGGLDGWQDGFDTWSLQRFWIGETIAETEWMT